MATPPSDESKKMFALLIDRDWHRYLDIREAIANSVPPGRALRRYHTEAQQYARKAQIKDPDYKGLKSDDEKIEIGKRQLAQVTITSWKRAGAVMERGEKSHREIKVRRGWTSTAFPGYEPQIEEDLEFEGEGSPEAPLADSEPSEVAQAVPEDVFVAVEPPEPPVRSEVPSEPELRPAPVLPRMQASEELRSFVNTGEGWKRAELFEDSRPLGNAVSPQGGLYPGPGSVAGCELCGQVVGNQLLHDQWHAEQKHFDTPSEMALLNESQLKDLIRKEIVDALDSFQVGMQDHLDSRFAQLEGIIAAVSRMSLRWTSTDVSGTERG